MNQCPHCQRSEQQVKVGFNESGSQRYLCQVCQRKYTPVPKVQGYSLATRQAALRLYADGMNLRRIARTLKVTHPTVANWVNAHAAQLPDSPPQPAFSAAVNELDELFTFVGSKKAKFISSRK
jgi:transposase-like protein